MQQQKSGENIHVTHWPDVSWNIFAKLQIYLQNYKKKVKFAPFFQQLRLIEVGSRSHQKQTAPEFVQRPPPQGGLRHACLQRLAAIAAFAPAQMNRTKGENKL